MLINSSWYTYYSKTQTHSYTLKNTYQQTKYTHTHTHAHTHTHKHTYIWYTHIYGTHFLTDANLRTFSHTHACTSAYVQTNTRVRTHTYTHIGLYTNTVVAN